MERQDGALKSGKSNWHGEKLDIIKTRVNGDIGRVEKYRGQQGKGRQAETPIPCLAVAESQVEYGAELFEQYQREHGAEQMDEATGWTVTQEVQKSR